MAPVSEATKYTVYGTAFGLCFPLGAVILLYVTGDLSAQHGPWAVVVRAHDNSLLYVIDSAPFFLGLFARLAGIRQDRLLAFAASLERQVALKTQSLVVALDEAKKANETIAHMADHDALTGLLNRRRLQKELEKWTQYALRYHQRAALAFIDLDKFKYINDTYGHHAGDRYLIEVSHVLSRALRATDILARWGGDEFAVLLPHTAQEAAADVATKLLQALNAAEVDIGGRPLHPSASVGVALFPDHAADLDGLVVYADAAMYEAKAAGRNCWRLYSSSSQEMERVQKHLQWEARLRRALENDQFLLFYQPLLRLADSATPGYEALLRMEGRDGELISPGLFLESAERFGLAVPIDYMVIRKAARRIGALSQHSVWISLNLSRPSLEDVKLTEHIQEVSAEYALRPGQLHIEITEAAAMEYLDRVRGLIGKLKAIGCRIVLDDFGRGPAYQYLQQLPVDMVKVDGELIRGLAARSDNRTRVREITELAHRMGIEVTAKHVEDAALLGILYDLGVDYAQGFAIGVPVEAIEHREVLQATGMS